MRILNISFTSYFYHVIALAGCLCGAILEFAVHKYGNIQNFAERNSPHPHFVMGMMVYTNETTYGIGVGAIPMTSVNEWIDSIFSQKVNVVMIS